MSLKKISAYTVYFDPRKQYFWLRLRLEDEQQSMIDVPFNGIEELSAAASLLRNETETFYDPKTGNTVIGWEPTGENHPS